MRLASGLAASLLMATPAFAADMLRPAAYRTAPAYQPAPAVIQSKVPACDNPSILQQLQHAFAHRERAYWHSNLSVTQFSDVRMVAYRPWKQNLIERVFCTGNVMLSDARLSKVHYSIGYRTGLAGTNFGLEWCVEGLDRNLAYAPNCKMAQP
jgi:hypothetical protein